MSMKHAEVQETLLEKGDSLSSLDMALETARTFEVTKKQLARLQAKIDVYAIQYPHSRISVEVREMWHTPCQVMGRLPRQGSKMQHLWVLGTLGCYM